MLRLVLGVLASRRSQAVTLAVLAVLAVAAGTAAPLYASAADRAVVAAELRAATAAERAITFTAEIAAANGYTSQLDSLRGQIAERTDGSGLTEIVGVHADGRVPGADPVDAPLSMRADVCDHLVFTAGSCPAAAGEVAISEPTAQRLGVGTGGEFVYEAHRAPERVTLRVVGVYDPAGPLATGDPYWAGRAGYTPRPQRVGNPLFVAAPTVAELQATTLIATVDMIAGDEAFTAGNLDGLTEVVKPGMGLVGVRIDNGLPRLLQRIEDTRAVLSLAAPLGAVQLLVVCWFVLLMAIGYTASERRSELALGLLRGVPPRHRALLALGPTALVLLVAAPFGVLLGWLLVRLLTWATFARAQDVVLGQGALLAAGGTLLVVMISAAVAERRVFSGSLMEGLRQVPTRRRRRVGLVELGVAVVALAAIGQSYASDSQEGGLPLLAPLLLAIVVGLLTARVVRSAATRFGASRLHRGRLAHGLAALQVARRPGADRLVALTVVAVALVGYTVSAWDVAANAARERAELTLGAPRALTVYAPSRTALLTAVAKADPAGAWAMAVTRQDDPDMTLLGVDSARLAAVALWPAGSTVSAADTARLLRAPAGEPVIVAGGGLEFDVSTTADFDGPMRLTAALVGPDGAPVTGAVEIADGAGRTQYRLDLPACAVAPGCRLFWLSFPVSPDGFRLSGLRQLGPDRTLLEGRAAGAASRWRAELGAEREVTVLNFDDGVSLNYVPSDPRQISTDIRLYVSDAPLPLPVVAAGPPWLAHTGELAEIEPLQALPRPVDLRWVSPVLPGAGTEGALFDLQAADRLSGSRDNAIQLQVWLNAAAPADAVDRLRAAGLVPVRDEVVAQRVDRYREQGAGLALRLHLAAAVLSVLLVALAVLVLAATDRRNRSAELAALRTQGLPAGAAARAGRLGNLAMIGIAAPVGALTAAVAWAVSGPARQMLTASGGLAPPGPGLAPVAAAIAAATAVLLVAALTAGRSLVRATTGRPGNAEGQR
ncbi:hypothetical protein [Catellatospora coxensis]|uniref:FtsX-like permease family protein n=1 Tax=Catellatospora coxensis TaxID=310354 RepID=A0A8J3KRZ3_9ACTN|nr:hypothetical protein [Catellatospora coxensis]GIG07992.1 hypothetical protein Cco03nite_46920 [Catellatospora coxensis]